MIRASLNSVLHRGTYEKILLRSSLYRKSCDKSFISEYQVERFNKIWRDTYLNIPFYEQWKQQNNLPDRISFLRELSDWPVITKKILQTHYNSLYRYNVKAQSFLQTGGSTGEPLRLPTWTDHDTAVSMWIGRSAYGILPGMKTFMIWGHRHLYGSGLTSYINTRKQSLKDWVSNRRRFSAYDLSLSKMKDYYTEYVNYAPDFVIGFSSSILAFVRANNDKDVVYHPKAVLCTAGPLTENEKQEISSFFQAPVCMEYGSVECGVMAYTEPETGEYRAFWDTHILQGKIDKYGECCNIVTQLTNRYIPLIRYDIGDYLEVDSSESTLSIIRIKNVKGRPSEMVNFKNDVCFFGALIGDCVKQVTGILSNQLHVYDEYLCVNVTADRKLTDADCNLIKKRMCAVIDNLEKEDIHINQVERLSTTVGGKTPLVIYHNK